MENTALLGLLILSLGIIGVIGCVMFVCIVRAINSERYKELQNENLVTEHACDPEAEYWEGRN